MSDFNPLNELLDPWNTDPADCCTNPACDCGEREMQVKFDAEVAPFEAQGDTGPAPILDPGGAAIELIRSNPANAARVQFAMATAVEYVLKAQPDLNNADILAAMRNAFLVFANHTIVEKLAVNPVGAYLNKIAVTGMLEWLKEEINAIEVPTPPVN